MLRGRAARRRRVVSIRFSIGLFLDVPPDSDPTLAAPDAAAPDRGRWSAAAAAAGRDHAAPEMSLEALGLLAGGIAHDFNNLLSAVRGNVEFARDALQASPPDPTAALADLAEVERATDRASALVRQLLAFGRRQPRAPEPLDLNAVVRDTATLLRVLVGDAVHLVLRLAPGVPAVHADRAQVGQVLLNLVLNARDAILDTQAGRRAGTGTLTLVTGTARVTGGDAPTAEGPAAGEYVTLLVRDDGVGMNDAVRSRIFEPFFTTKGVDRGTGLGLAATWGIVRQSGGGIRVDSRPGEGSTFVVFWPVAADGAADAPAEAPAALGAPGARPNGRPDQPPARPGGLPNGAPAPDAGRAEPAPPDAGAPHADAPDAPDAGARPGPTVLLAEDEHAVRRIVARVLRRAGYRVLEAGDGRDALALWQAHADTVDALLADIRMPHLRGDALARTLVEERPSLPVVLMTGFADEPVALAPGAAGRDGAVVTPLAKPFTALELLARLTTALGAGAVPSDRPVA